MAVVTTHVLSVTYATSDGTVTHRYANFNPETTSEDISNFTAGVIVNGDIFDKVPVIARSAKIVATTTTDVELE